MNRQSKIASWLMGCPQLASLWSIAAEEQDGANIIFPIGSSMRRNINDRTDITGGYEADIVPLPSVYEEYQINCYKNYTNNADEWNIMKLEEVEKVIDWINAQDEALNFPDIGENIVSVETFPFIPQIRFADPQSRFICYYITLRIRYVNKAKGRSVAWMSE